MTNRPPSQPPNRRFGLRVSLARRFTFRTLLIMAAFETVAAIVFVIIVGIAYYYFDTGDSGLIVITATPPDDLMPPVANQPDAGAVTYDSTGLYAFPIAADPYYYVWTHYHWDGTHAADIEARFGLSYTDFLQVTGAQLVAITNGIAVNYSGNIGGQGYILHGDDGFDYYYAHMSAQWVTDGARVTVGQPLGLIGNTGGSAQFIEPHLHLAIGPRDSLWEEMPSVNAAEWLSSTFSLGWQERSTPPSEPATPGGWPVQHPALSIVTPFTQAEALGLPQPAIELGFVDAPPNTPLDVIAPLSGEINVIRWTTHYGTRIQINNDATLSTVVISGVDEWLVQDGDVVNQGQVIGRWNPANRPKLHYMIYENSVIIDPTPSLVWE